MFIDIIDKIFCGISEEMLRDGKTKKEVDDFFHGDKFFDVYSYALSQMTESFTESITQNLLIYDKDEKEQKGLYSDHIESIWGEGLAWVRQYYSKCLDICEGYRSRVNESKIISDRCNTAKALHAIHCKALQVYAEIICLIENGFPDGAFAHFRILYELWAVSEFIADDTDAVAAAYIESVDNKSNRETDHYKWAKKSEKLSKSDKPITIHAIVKEMYKIIKLKVKEEASNSHLDAVYMFPNYIIHPSAKGVFGRTSLPSQEMIAGAVDTGLSVPAINSSKIMHNISINYMKLFPNEVSIIGLGILNNIVSKRIVPIFNRIDKQLSENNKG